MRLLTFRRNDGWHFGIKVANEVVDIPTVSNHLGTALSGEPVPHSIEALFAGGDGALVALRRLMDAVDEQEENPAYLLREETLQLGPCVSRQGKIICVGLNYRRHAEETGAALPTSPVLFPKYANSLAASGDIIPLPHTASQFDYEAELALVIGRRAKEVSEQEALSYVFGYCNANDLSARDLQFRTSQWMLGKALDKFLPIGPYLVTADEVEDPQQLRIRCLVNGQVRQDSTTADMIFPVAYLVSYISQYLTLEAGDILVTGTPEGVILGKQDPQWLTAGDEVVVELTGLGRLVNVLQ